MQSPGQIIQAKIELTQLSQKTVALIAGLAPATLNRVIKNKKSVDVGIALRLEAAIGVSAEELLFAQLQQDLTDNALDQSERKQIEFAKKIYSLVPVDEMLARGWLTDIKDANDITAIESSLKKFFGVEDLAQVLKKDSHAAKKTNEFSPLTPSQRAWIGRARNLAHLMRLEGSFSPTKKTELINQLHFMLMDPKQVVNVCRLLSGYGIRVVYVQTLKSSKIDGACLWLAESEPVIAMSLRYDRIDNFWFVLRHELEHVFRGDGLHETSLDAIEDCELSANKAYLEFIDPADLIASRIQKTSGRISKEDVLGLANKLRIHPGLVAGQIQFQTKSYAIFRNLQEKVRDYLLCENSNVDGWGLFQR